MPCNDGLLATDRFIQESLNMFGGVRVYLRSQLANQNQDWMVSVWIVDVTLFACTGAY